MANEVLCEYAANGICEDSQRETLGYCPDRVRILCAAACSARIMNSHDKTPLWRVAQLVQGDQPLLGKESIE